MKIWLKELNSYQPITGEPRQEGTKTRLLVNVGGGMEVTETVLTVDFPNRFSTHYEMQGGTFVADSKLEHVDEKNTRYVLEHHFQFTGPLKMVTALLKPAFIAHSKQIMENFKALAEDEKNEKG
jgi:hypothetical protein